MCKKLGVCLCILVFAIWIGCDSRKTELPKNPTTPPAVDAVNVIGPGGAAKNASKSEEK